MNTILAAMLPHLLELGVTGFLAIASFAAARFARFLGLASDDKVRGALLAMVEVVAEAARERLEDAVGRLPAGSSAPAGQLVEPIISQSADYVQQHMPDALRQLGVGREGVERMLRLRLGLHE
jgi:hypothetical protein